MGQIAVATAKASDETAVHEGKPKTRAAIGAMTPVTTVAVANLLKRYKPEEIVAKLRQLGVLVLQDQDLAVTDTLSSIARPRGRKPSDNLLRLSNWYTGLDACSRTMLAQALKLAVHGCATAAARRDPAHPPNGKEHAGLRLFSKLLDNGRLPRPFRPINEAP